MLSKILGAVTITTGLLWLAKPQILQNRLKKKMNRNLKFTVFGFIIVFGFLILGSVIKAPGLIPKIAGIAGLVIAIKGIRILTSKASERVLEWWANKPLGFFRIWAAFVLATGIALILS